MPSPKQSFVFSSARGLDLPSDVRAANALEFIAHYLDRIDGHLERLAFSAQNLNGAADGIRMEAAGIGELLKRQKQ